MMADQRNFRSSYLEKVGIKGVEEKKSLEILLKEQNLDFNKLVQFSLRFPVPTCYRPFLWKVLLGVLPAHQASHELVLRQRAEQYNDLYEALVAMQRIDDHTPLTEEHLRMFLLEEGTLPFDEQKMMKDPCNQVFLAIATAMSEIEEDPIQIYWLATRFFKLQSKYKVVIPLMKERVEYYLGKEDGDGKLCCHLVKLNVFKHLPLVHWFHCGYAGVLPETFFERIWDKLIGGSGKILVYVAVAILLTFRRPLLSMRNVDDILRYLSQIPADSGDIIVSKAIDIWQKHGSLLMPVVAKSDSPGLVERSPS